MCIFKTSYVCLAYLRHVSVELKHTSWLSINSVQCDDNKLCVKTVRLIQLIVCHEFSMQKHMVSMGASQLSRQPAVYDKWSIGQHGAPMGSDYVCIGLNFTADFPQGPVMCSGVSQVSQPLLKYIIIIFFFTVKNDADINAHIN